MLIYQGTKDRFRTDAFDGTLVESLERNLLERMHKKPSPAEVSAWRNSLAFMDRVLETDRIPKDAGVAIEYNIPQTSKRVDFMVSGYDAEGHGSVVIIELKQWQELSRVPGRDALVETYTGGALRRVVHPSYQAWSYAAFISAYSEDVQDRSIGLRPCAYLHNYVRHAPDPVDDRQYQDYTQDAPVFDSHEAAKLQDFIAAGILRGDQCQNLYAIDSGRLRPSKSLQECIASMVAGNREFTLIDDQKVAYEEILAIAENARRQGRRETVLVQGGPGTGKSVLAINLLAELTRRGQFCQYVSKNAAPRKVYAQKLKQTHRKSAIDVMFRGSGCYTEARPMSVDTLLADEAHRLNRKSGMYKNLGENQIKEIISAARCSVCFLDEDQRVTMSDIGSADEIRHWARLLGSEVTELELASQFRCNGSDGYLAWLDNLLGIRETANALPPPDYAFCLMESPQAVLDAVIAHNGSNRSRLVAGYCWNWISSGKDNPAVKDIVIGDFAMSWNLGNTETWAIDPDSVQEAGCIHTCQGLEFDYVGVIIGPDLRCENGTLVTDASRRARTDKSLSGIRKLMKKDPEKARKLADRIIRNTYRTLMTRGLKGCFVWCADAGLQAFIRAALAHRSNSEMQLPKLGAASPETTSWIS